MATPQTDGEILEFAIWKEHQAGRLFRALAAKIHDPDAAELLERLAEEEAEHMARLQLEVMKSGRTINTDQDDSDLSTPELVIADAAELNMSPVAILDLAIQKEEASFRLYVSLIPQVRTAESREMLLALAQEEVRHKIHLEAELERIEKK